MTIEKLIELLMVLPLHYEARLGDTATDYPLTVKEIDHSKGYVYIGEDREPSTRGFFAKNGN